MSTTRNTRNPGGQTTPSAEFLNALRGVRRPFVVGHVTPDADSLSAAFATASLLRDNGADAAVVVPRRAIAKKLQFLVDIAAGVPLLPTPPPGADAAVIVDTATIKRVNLDGGFDTIAALESFNIDHHITNPDYARHNWVDPHASSTSELIARLAAAAGWKLSRPVASLLYAGMHGDTAGFSLPNTTADALHIAADLVRAGADVTHIGEQLCRSQGRPDFELLRRVYDHTRLTDDGRIAYSYISYDDITAAGCSADDIDDQVSIPRALRGIRIAMLFSEGEPGIIRVNLRGEGNTSVIEIAEHFGGGGHTQSAGVRLRNKPMQQAIDEVLAAACRHIA